ncbi:type II toxin-antitoxin system HicB family antitoxin [Desulfofundulus thermocisternus]|uniref:type II toxin-antitoxin system HicB family antitoxin n=1 Tax=Desulfofundulus thermocisternus TaxID=42471 RepID=UPI0019E46D22|nr:type II toxin-antitoxin system HicB family antitoxin [Desulfofundulus thermocisternus]MBE3586231.1 type II toxin-antitoxin system HicB family antitoxin [Thermoanaerobacter sp.]MCS5695255.1 type II toxin-antitoxin system HicB family antitoxin [Desulfofundulus thermocisternus]
MLYRYKVILEWDEEGKGYVVSVPALPGCFTQGDTVEEALERAQEAIAGHLAALVQEGLSFPIKDVEIAEAQEV